MALTSSSQKRRVGVLEKVASETFVDPSIAQGVSSPDKSQQVAALRSSGASPSELRVASKALEEKGGAGKLALVALAGSIASLFAGYKTVGAFRAPIQRLAGIGWLIATFTAASITLSSILNRRESRRLAPVLSEAATSIEAAQPAASLMASAPATPYLLRS